MPHYVIRIARSTNLTACRCDRCRVVILDTYYNVREVAAVGSWRKRFCGGCVSRLDVVHDYYLEVPGLLWTDTFYDLASVRWVRPDLIPSLTASRRLSW